MAKEKQIGEVTHYFNKIGVAVVKLGATLKTGEDVHIKGATTDFTQKVDSMQVEHENVDEAKKGESIGMKVKKPVRQKDKVYAVSK